MCYTALDENWTCLNGIYITRVFAGLGVGLCSAPRLNVEGSFVACVRQKIHAITVERSDNEEGHWRRIFMFGGEKVMV
jgi:hypothetical protein